MFNFAVRALSKISVMRVLDFVDSMSAYSNREIQTPLASRFPVKTSLHPVKARIVRTINAEVMLRRAIFIYGKYVAHPRDARYRPFRKRP